MIGFETPLALLVAAPLLYLWWRVGRGPRQVWPLRVAILVLCTLALASPFLHRRGAGRHVVFLVDRSLSAGTDALRTASELVELAERRKGPGDRVSVVMFGDGASVLLGASGAPSEVKSSALDDASDLHAGLRLAAAISTTSGGGRVCVVSDGLYTGPDPMELVPELRRKGIGLDYVPIEREHKKDVAVTGVALPERVRTGHPFEAVITVSAPVAARATLRVRSDEVLFEQEVTLRAGENRFVFKHVLERVGLARFTVTAVVAGDTRPENNRAAAVTEVVGPSEVLVITQSGKPDNLARALAASGMRVRVAGPGIAGSSAALKGFSAIVLDNVALSSMPDRADAAIRNYVRETGGGLLVTGGKNSYASGGYYRSRLEPILPVSMARKEEFRRPQLALAIVLDRSGSMAAPVGVRLTKMDLANRAAAEAVALLQGQDEVAVLAIDSTAHRVVPLTRVGGNYAGIRKKILSIESMGGGIYVYTGLRAAMVELRRSRAPTRHIVLFSDAADSEEPGDYKKLVDLWAKAGGTITVIGLGTKTDCDADFLRDIAARSNGSITFTSDARALPRIFCQDAMRIARKTFIERETHARVTPAIAQMGRLGIWKFPSFGGYNLCHPREEAAQMVVTTDEHAAPVLAAWQRGLGRAAALTCEADGPYSGKLATWDQYSAFFSSVIKWLERGRDDPALFGTIVRRGRTARVVFEMDSAAAARCTGATALIIPPDESGPIKVPLQWDSPRTMRGTFRLRQNGVYHGLVLTRERRRVGLPPVVLPYSPEFEPKAPGAGVEVLRRMAAATGGDVVMHVGDLFSRPRAAVASDRAATDLAPWLAAAIIVLLLCEIVTRRALWAHVVPRFVRSGYAGARVRLAAAAARVRRRLERRLTRDVAEPTAAETPEAPGATAPPEEAPGPTDEKPKPSVFDRAKRRSRR